MSKPRNDEPLKMPYYKGGEEALRQFIRTQLNYPQEALTAQVEGVVEARYDVDGLGRTRNIKIVSSLGYGCDEEVIRLVGLLKYEKAYNKGRNVTLHRKAKVNFTLPKKEEKKTQINYHLVNAPAQKEKAKKKAANITYTLTFGSSTD